MARIRSVKPELRRSLTVSSWKRETRYAWVLLWGYLDDYGYGVDDIRLITSDLFPLDRDVTERKMNNWLLEMATPAGDDEPPALCRFEINGRRYLHAVKWADHQKPAHPTDSRFPSCPVHGPTQWPRKPPGKPPGDTKPPEDFVNGSGEIHDPLTNGSRTVPLAPTRVAAEQGEGSRETGAREVETGAGLAPVGAGTLANLIPEWIDHCQPKPPGRVVSQVAKLLAELVREGYDFDHIRRGLARWHERGLHASVLPSVVYEVARGPRTRPNRATERLQANLAVVRSLEAQERPEIA